MGSKSIDRGAHHKHDMPGTQRKIRLKISIKSITQSKIHRLISIPELLIMIVGGFKLEDQRKLMHVSKHFFHCMGPILWRSVPRLELIIELIKGTKFGYRLTEHPQSQKYKHKVVGYSLKFARECVNTQLDYPVTLKARPYSF